VFSLRGCLLDTCPPDHLDAEPRPVRASQERLKTAPDRRFAACAAANLAVDRQPG